MAVMKARIHFKERSRRPERPRYPPYHPPSGMVCLCAARLDWATLVLALQSVDGRSSVAILHDMESDGRWSMVDDIGSSGMDGFKFPHCCIISSSFAIRWTATFRVNHLRRLATQTRSATARTAPYRHSSIEIIMIISLLPSTSLKSREGRMEMHFVAMDHRGTGRQWVLLPLRCGTKRKMEGIREIAGEMPIVATDTDTDEYRHLVEVLNAEVERECY
ncbi:hypothetical protein C8F01DRAFT_1372160 [Mycena amicta]|nr:hypothetical protein C8F01DRAFT_1372160 [Mycena amicta]